MHADDSAAFTQRLNILGELFEKQLSPAVKALYFDTLRDLPLDAVLTALDCAARTCTFFPKPAEVRALIAGDSELETERAWQLFRATITRVGGYGSPTFEDAAIADAVVAMFGSWEEACWADFSPEMWASKRKEFGRVYALMRAEGRQGSRTLDGYCARMNRLNYGVADPLHGLPGADPSAKLLGSGAAPSVPAPIPEEREQREQQRARIRAGLQAAVDAHYAKKDGVTV